MNLEAIDWLIMAVYFTFVLGIGFYLKRSTKTSSDFFEAGKSIPAWVAGLAFLSANLGAQEVIGMAASGAKYGLATSHFYWVGAIPAMVFVGIFMMPFYYGSKARSVPEYLRLRFDEKTRAFNAITFAAMTIFSSGVSMYAMAKLIGVLHLLDGPLSVLGLDQSWVFLISITISAVIVLGYIFLGGLASAIYNEVLQFFLIVAGFFPLVWLGLKNVGGWQGLKDSLDPRMMHAWQGMSSPDTNLMGVEWFGMVMGLGFVLSFGYWCTDFLVIQRAMAADSMNSARRTPLIGAVPKMLFPFLVILPGLIAVALPTPDIASSANNAAQVQEHGGVQRPPGLGLVPAKVNEVTGEVMKDSAGKPLLDYDLVIPNLLLHYFPPGMLGLGLTALLASFMSGMAGNVTAFNTVFTYDIYQAYIKKDGDDQHYLMVGRMATVFGILASMVAAYLATQWNNIMDLLQLIFAFVNAPLFATFLLGMFSKRTTGHGAFAGLVSGTLAAAIHHGLTLPRDAVGAGFKGGWLGQVLHSYPSDMAQNFWTAIWAWSVCFVVTIVVSHLTKPHKEEELVGLVYSLTERPKDEGRSIWAKPEFFGALVLLATLILNLVFA